MSTQMKDLLIWLGYSKDNSHKLTTLAEWTNLTRRVCYFSNHGSKNLYQNIIPSDSALNLHRLRGEFVIKFVLEIPVQFSDHYKLCEQYGWIQADEGIQIKWDKQMKNTRKELTTKRNHQLRNVVVVQPKINVQVQHVKTVM